MEAILDLQTAFNMAVALGAFLGGWVLNTLWQAIKDLQANEKALSDKVAAVEVLVAGRYMTREEHAASMARVESSLIRIEGKIDHKADR
jgi:hypothetical protein